MSFSQKFIRFILIELINKFIKRKRLRSRNYNKIRVKLIFFLRDVEHLILKIIIITYISQIILIFNSIKFYLITK